jgi:hypothetical protein
MSGSQNKFIRRLRAIGKQDLGRDKIAGKTDFAVASAQETSFRPRP